MNLLETAHKVITDPIEYAKWAEHFSSEALQATPGAHAYKAHMAAAQSHDQCHTMFGNKAGQTGYGDVGKHMDHHKSRSAFHAAEAKKHEHASFGG